MKVLKYTVQSCNKNDVFYRVIPEPNRISNSAVRIHKVLQRKILYLFVLRTPLYVFNLVADQDFSDKRSSDCI